MVERQVDLGELAGVGEVERCGRCKRFDLVRVQVVGHVDITFGHQQRLRRTFGHMAEDHPFQQWLAAIVGVVALQNDRILGLPGRD
ncbi:hypothetical protein D3C78_1738680 [compost metagenome]